MDKILLVDDVKLLLEVQKGFLATSRLQILTANDGYEALAVARNERPHLIVMDKYMPNMDGVTCCRALKADPLLKHIPVIMLTNALKPSDFEEYKAAGCDDCLPKPVDSKLFLATIKKYLPSVECRRIRVPLSTEVCLHSDDGFHVGMTRDIGLNGVYVATEMQPATGEEVKFSFVLPGSEAPIEVRGKVAWLKKRSFEEKTGFSYGFGVEFVEITGKGIPLLRKSELNIFVSRYSEAAGADHLDC